jgi:hypothetical protein
MIITAQTAYGKKVYKLKPFGYKSYGLKLLGNVPVRKSCGAKRVRSLEDLGYDTGNTEPCADGYDGYYLARTSGMLIPSVPYACGEYMYIDHTMKCCMTILS